jgi:2-C-methyl-D-erythritol 4-phosphate cytidylyltransferase
VNAAVVIAAAGGGRRLTGVAKAFVPLAGQPMLRHALQPFLAETRVVQLVVALQPSSAESPPPWLASLDARIDIVAGGDQRSDSVRLALDRITPEAEIVMVHDAARPLVSRAVVERVLDAAQLGQCVIAAAPVTDTIHEVDAGRIVATPGRERLWYAQTPQAFPRQVLVEAHRRALRDRVRATDDAALVARYGTPVFVVEGDRENIKVTTPADLVMAAALLERR